VTGRLILVGCGGRKLDHPDQPARLYVGSYFTACLDTALAVRNSAVNDRVMILSAKHGLLNLWAPVIEPYDLRLGQPGAISVGTLHSQAVARNVYLMPVLALCGGAYATLARQVWENVETPLAGLGIGRQVARLKEMRDEV